MGIYLFKASVLLAIMYCLYSLLFRRDTFFRLRRATLLAIYALSLVLPLVDISAWTERQEALSGLAISYPSVLLPELAASPENAAPWSLASVLFLVWIAGMVVLDTRLVISLCSILDKARHCPVIEIDGMKVRRLGGGRSRGTGPAGDDGPFSFFKWIFVNPDAQDTSTLSDILAHEQAHVAQWHSIDVIFSELMSVVFFFNPFAWLMRRAVRENLEYLADEQVISRGSDPKTYQYHLLNIAYNKSVATLSNSFNVLPLKKRIVMMNKKRSSNFCKLKYLLLLPVAALLLAACNLTPSPTPVPERRQGQAAESVADTLDAMPEFPGGSAALTTFLLDNIRYPEATMRSKTQGSVVVSFTVKADGTTGGVRVEKSLSKECDAEAVRVVRLMPKWTPGKKGGRNVAARLEIPITFKLY